MENGILKHLKSRKFFSLTIYSMYIKMWKLETTLEKSIMEETKKLSIFGVNNL